MQAAWGMTSFTFKIINFQKEGDNSSYSSVETDNYFTLAHKLNNSQTKTVNLVITNCIYPT